MPDSCDASAVATALPPPSPVHHPHLDAMHLSPAPPATLCVGPAVPIPDDQPQSTPMPDFFHTELEVLQLSPPHVASEALHALFAKGDPTLFDLPSYPNSPTMHFSPSAIFSPCDSPDTHLFHREVACFAAGGHPQESPPSPDAAPQLVVIPTANAAPHDQPADVRALLAIVTSMQAEAVQLRQSNAAKEQKVHALTAQLSASETERAGLQTRQATLLIELARLESDLLDARRECDEMFAALELAAANETSLRGQLLAETTASAHLRTSIATSQMALADCRRECNDWHTSYLEIHHKYITVLNPQTHAPVQPAPDSRVYSPIPTFHPHPVSSPDEAGIPAEVPIPGPDPPAPPPPPPAPPLIIPPSPAGLCRVAHSMGTSAYSMVATDIDARRERTSLQPTPDEARRARAPIVFSTPVSGVKRASSDASQQPSTSPLQRARTSQSAPHQRPHAATSDAAPVPQAVPPKVGLTAQPRPYGYVASSRKFVPPHANSQNRTAPAPRPAAQPPHYQVNFCCIGDEVDHPPPPPPPPHLPPADCDPEGASVPPPSPPFPVEPVPVIPLQDIVGRIYDAVSDLEQHLRGPGGHTLAPPGRGGETDIDWALSTLNKEVSNALHSHSSLDMEASALQDQVDRLREDCDVMTDRSRQQAQENERLLDQLRHIDARARRATADAVLHERLMRPSNDAILARQERAILIPDGESHDGLVQLLHEALQRNIHLESTVRESLSTQASLTENVRMLERSLHNQSRIHGNAVRENDHLRRQAPQPLITGSEAEALLREQVTYFATQLLNERAAHNQYRRREDRLRADVEFHQAQADAATMQMLILENHMRLGHPASARHCSPPSPRPSRADPPAVPALLPPLQLPEPRSLAPGGEDDIRQTISFEEAARRAHRRVGSLPPPPAKRRRDLPPQSPSSFSRDSLEAPSSSRKLPAPTLHPAATLSSHPAALAPADRAATHLLIERMIEDRSIEPVNKGSNLLPQAAEPPVDTRDMHTQPAPQPGQTGVTDSYPHASPEICAPHALHPDAPAPPDHVDLPALLPAIPRTTLACHAPTVCITPKPTDPTPLPTHAAMTVTSLPPINPSSPGTPIPATLEPDLSLLAPPIVHTALPTPLLPPNLNARQSTPQFVQTNFTQARICSTPVREVLLRGRHALHRTPLAAAPQSLPSTTQDMTTGTSPTPLGADRVTRSRSRTLPLLHTAPPIHHTPASSVPPVPADPDSPPPNDPAQDMVHMVCALPHDPLPSQTTLSVSLSNVPVGCTVSVLTTPTPSHVSTPPPRCTATSARCHKRQSHAQLGGGTRSPFQFPTGRARFSKTVHVLAKCIHCGRREWQDRTDQHASCLICIGSPPAPHSECPGCRRHTHWIRGNTCAHEGCGYQLCDQRQESGRRPAPCYPTRNVHSDSQSHTHTPLEYLDDILVTCTKCGTSEWHDRSDRRTTCLICSMTPPIPDNDCSGMPALVDGPDSEDDTQPARTVPNTERAHPLTPKRRPPSNTAAPTTSLRLMMHELVNQLRLLSQARKEGLLPKPPASIQSTPVVKPLPRYPISAAGRQLQSRNSPPWSVLAVRRTLAAAEASWTASQNPRAAPKPQIVIPNLRPDTPSQHHPDPLVSSRLQRAPLSGSQVLAILESDHEDSPTLMSCPDDENDNQSGEDDQEVNCVIDNTADHGGVPQGNPVALPLVCTMTANLLPLSFIPAPRNDAMQPAPDHKQLLRDISRALEMVKISSVLINGLPHLHRLLSSLELTMKAFAPPLAVPLSPPPPGPPATDTYPPAPQPTPSARAPPAPNPRPPSRWDVPPATGSRRSLRHAREISATATELGIPPRVPPADPIVNRMAFDSSKVAWRQARAIKPQCLYMDHSFENGLSFLAGDQLILMRRVLIDGGANVNMMHVREAERLQITTQEVDCSVSLADGRTLAKSLRSAHPVTVVLAATGHYPIKMTAHFYITTAQEPAFDTLFSIALMNPINAGARPFGFSGTVGPYLVYSYDPINPHLDMVLPLRYDSGKILSAVPNIPVPHPVARSPLITVEPAQANHMIACTSQADNKDSAEWDYGPPPAPPHFEPMASILLAPLAVRQAVANLGSLLGGELQPTPEDLLLSDRDCSSVRVCCVTCNQAWIINAFSDEGLLPAWCHTCMRHLWGSDFPHPYACNREIETQVRVVADTRTPLLEESRTELRQELLMTRVQLEAAREVIRGMMGPPSAGTLSASQPVRTRVTSAPTRGTRPVVERYPLGNTGNIIHLQVDDLEPAEIEQLPRRVIGRTLSGRGYSYWTHGSTAASTSSPGPAASTGHTR